MPWTFKDLDQKSDDDITAQYDQEVSKYSGVSGMPDLDFYLNELQRREQDRATQRMLQYTLAITFMTLAMLAATIVNVVLVFRQH